MDESSGAVEVSAGSIEGTGGIRLFDGAGERYGEIESNSVTATVGPSNDGGTDDGSETDPSTAGSGGGDVDASSSDTSSDSDSDGTDGRDTGSESPPTHVGTTRGRMRRTPPLTIAPARVRRPIVRRTSAVNRHRTQPLRGPKRQNWTTKPPSTKLDSAFSRPLPRSSPSRGSPLADTGDGGFGGRVACGPPITADRWSRYRGWEFVSLYMIYWPYTGLRWIVRTMHSAPL